MKAAGLFALHGETLDIPSGAPSGCAGAGGGGGAGAGVCGAVIPLSTDPTRHGSMLWQQWVRVSKRRLTAGQRCDKSIRRKPA